MNFGQYNKRQYSIRLMNIIMKIIPQIMNYFIDRDSSIKEISKHYWYRQVSHIKEVHCLIIKID